MLMINIIKGKYKNGIIKPINDLGKNGIKKDVIIIYEDDTPSAMDTTKFKEIFSSLKGVLKINADSVNLQHEIGKKWA